MRRVVIATEDPFAAVDGGGMRQLADAGIETGSGVLAEQAAFLNAPYFKRVRSGLPWVIAKWAMTADGRIATADDQSQWITGDKSRADVHQLRGRVDAIITGMGTVVADNPTLTARPPGPRVASRVVMCRHRWPSVESNLVLTADQSPLITATADSNRSAEEWERRGIDFIRCRSDDRVEMVSEMLAELGRREMTNVMIEGGGELLASFFDAGQIDECHVYLGAKAFGGQKALGPIGGNGVSAVGDAMRLQLISVDQFDHDVKAVYRKNAGPTRNL